MNVEQLVAFIKNPCEPMPQVFPAQRPLDAILQYYGLDSQLAVVASKGGMASP